MSFAFYLVSLSFVVHLALSALVVSRGIARPVNQAFLLLSVSIGAWLICLWVGLRKVDPVDVELWIRLTTAVALLMPLSLFFLCETISSQARLPQVIWRQWPWLVVTLAVSALCGTRFFLKGIGSLSEPVDDFVKVAVPEYGPGFPIYVFWPLVLFVVTLSRGLIRRRSLMGIVQVEMDYALAGVIVFNVLVLGFAGIGPLLSKESQAIQLPSLWVLILDGIIAYGITTRRLLGLGTLARRFAANGLWAVYLAIAYCGIWWLARNALRSLAIPDELLSHVIPALVIILWMGSAKSHSQRVIQRLFLKTGRIDLKQHLREIDAVGLESGSQENFALGCLKILARSAGTDDGLIYFADGDFCVRLRSGGTIEEPGERLRAFAERFQRKADPIVANVLNRQAEGYDPLSCEFVRWDASLALRIPGGDNVGGIVLLGERLSHHFYDWEDVDAIQVLVDRLATGHSRLKFLSNFIRANSYQQTVLDQFINGVVATDGEGNVSILNREARRIFHGEAVPSEILDIIASVLSTGVEARDRELCLRFNEERAIPVRVSCRRFNDPDGGVLGASLLCVDLSEVKLLQQQLLQSERLASIGSLSANIAHEIKNPLVAIKSFSQLLPERLTDQQFLTEFARLMRKEVERIDQIINNLLVWARPKAQHPEAVNVEELLIATLTLYRLNLTGQAIVVEENFVEPPALIHGFRQEMQQIFSNLILNAIEAMPKGGRLVLKTLRRPGQVEIVVADTGEGIPEAIKGDLFRPYFTSKKGGTGLGLSGVKEIMDRQGATIVVESGKKGTEFHLIFKDI